MYVLLIGLSAIFFPSPLYLPRTTEVEYVYTLQDPTAS